MSFCRHLRQLLIPSRIHLLKSTKLQTFSSMSQLSLGSSGQLNVIIPVCNYVLCHAISSAKSLNHRLAAESSSFCLFNPELRCVRYNVKPVVIERTFYMTRILLKKKKQTSSSSAAAADEDTEDESEKETDSENEDDTGISDEEEDGVPKDYKDVHHNLSSLRLDAVLSKGLNISRKKIEDDFLSTKLRLNGSVVTKKGKQVSAGDTLDLIRGTGDGQDGMVSVMRLVVKRVLPDKTSKGNTRVVLRRWKNLKVPKSEL